MNKYFLCLALFSSLYLYSDSDEVARNSEVDDFFSLFESEYEKPSKNKAPKKLNAANASSSDSNADDHMMNQRLGQTSPKPIQHDAMNHYMIYGDFLYWQPFCNDLTWGNLTQNPSQGSYTEQYRFSFDWDVGFRVGLQFKTTWQDITFDGNWTSFENTSKSKKQNKNILASSTTSLMNYGLQGDSYSIFQQNQSPPGYTFPLGWKISSSYTVDFNQFDFLIKKSCNISEKFKLKPLVGVRGLVLNHYFTTQSFTNSYNNVFTTIAPFDYSEIKQTNNSNAIGLILGVDNHLIFGKGFGMFFNGDFFIGYGKDNSYFWNFYNEGGTKSSPEYIFQKSNSMKSMLDVAAGLSWERGLFKNAIELLISVGYEFHYIFQNPTFIYGNAGYQGVPQSTSYQDTSKSFGFQGLMVRGGFGF